MNGAVTFAQRLAERLVKRGHEAHVSAPAPAAGPGTRVENDITVHRVPFITVHRVPFRETPFLRQIRPDTVPVQSHLALRRTPAAAARGHSTTAVAANPFIPENLIGCTRPPSRLAATASQPAWRGLARIHRRAHLATVPTPRAVPLLPDHGLKAPVLTVSRGSDPERFSPPSPPREPGTVRVPFAGHSDQGKNVHDQAARRDPLEHTP
ncbi:glycosyltransferase [Streptomyces sp. NPDC093085]|uniref:glycosyltransferase n=1 Tax=Streptomyces sp. NPDC093085 TaxID=3155068 RepID=UPI0034160AD9